MDLLSVFKRKLPAAPAPEAADAVQRARTRARQRLIGAAVLVVVGIIGFPLLFETQPRPIPVDLPIEIPHKDALAPLTVPNPPAETVAAAVPVPVPAKAAPPAERVIVETQADAGRELAASATEPAPAAASASHGASGPAKAVAAEPVKARPVTPPPLPASAQTPAAGDGARAQALLEGKPNAATGTVASAVGTARFVVQVGAFADANALRDARAKVERLGMKTYTQVVETPAGPRTRVRVGPFASREEADRAAAKIKAAALPAAILTL